MKHYFCKSVAIRYGVRAAVVAQFLWDRIGKNAVCKADCYWTSCSILIMTGYFPFYSEHMLRDTLHQLVKERVIARKKFEKSEFNHTYWYTFTPYGQYLMNDESEELHGFDDVHDDGGL